ncbi:heme lyase CcmF/NrfE family subunit [Gemmatimonas sp.]|uniref:heme lyase CcmF/NrfE family subunit n=1 Tax=Gemmatimonas sp. TaxID=1962908 RepID=UPI003569AA97
MILVGELSLWVALLMAAWTTTVSFSGGLQGRPDLVKSGERALYATFGFTLLASIGLWTALFMHDFSIKFVASYTSTNLPKIYTFTAFWAGQSGSMLFWALILTAYSAIAVFSNRKTNRAMMPYVTGTLGIICLFFLMTMCFGANPYERLDWIPPEGRGMNPQLQNPGMAIHPPMLYLGLVGTAIPFAFAIGALVTRQLDAQWLGAVRRWALLSWFFLTIGIVLGMWWAYVELGWAGYWAWDAVENSSFLPWLTITAFLHSIMIQEKRGMLRKWNVTLVAMSFLLTILGTFITRSGIIESVHAFAQSPVGDWFLVFLIGAAVATAYLVSTRLNDLQANAELESMVSREAAFLYNNLVLIGICFATLWGVLFPILSEWVKGDKITVGPPFFNAVNGPLGLLLLALTGIGPLIAWRRASTTNLKRQFTWPVISGVVTFTVLFALGMRQMYALVSYLLAGFVFGTIIQEFVKGIDARRRMYGEGLFSASMRLVGRNRRRYGGYIVHFGVAILFCAFAGLMFKKDLTATLKAGESVKAKDAYGSEWVFTSQGISSFEQLNRRVVAASFNVTRDGKNMGILSSEKRQHVNAAGEPTFEPSTEVGILESPKQDVYLVFTGAVDRETAAIHINFNPLVWWVWFGGIIMAFGGLIVMWPQAVRAEREGGYVAELPSESTLTLVGAGA